MPNYTLYIKHPKFKDEENKSGLVNDLLASHYGDTFVPKSKSHSNKKLASAMSSGEIKKVSGFEIIEQATPGEIFAGRTCKAGHPSKDGKHCMNIKCAYFHS